MFKERKTYQDVREELQKSAVYRTFQQIIPGLFIGPAISAMEINKMREHNIS